MFYCIYKGISIANSVRIVIKQMSITIFATYYALDQVIKKTWPSERAQRSYCKLVFHELLFSTGALLSWWKRKRLWLLHGIARSCLLRQRQEGNTQISLLKDSISVPRVIELNQKSLQSYWNCFCLINKRFKFIPVIFVGLCLACTLHLRHLLYLSFTDSQYKWKYDSVVKLYQRDTLN